jgi:hypothetical protein
MERCLILYDDSSEGRYHYHHHNYEENFVPYLKALRYKHSFTTDFIEIFYFIIPSRSSKSVPTKSMNPFLVSLPEL